MISVRRLLSPFIILAIILLVWIAQVLFLHEAAKWGMNGWDDWGFLYYYDVHRGNDIGNFLFITNDQGTPYYWTETYYIGPLKDIVGLNQNAFKLVELLWKGLAATTLGYLVFKFTKNKIFGFFAIFFFIIFPSTAGVLSHVVLSGGFLTVVFAAFSLMFYIYSFKIPSRIILSSLFFFLALLACPPRAYPLLPLPLIGELIRLKLNFRPMIFLRRMMIFYLPVLLFLRSNSGWFEPQKEIFIRIHQVVSGNLYTLTFPFQMIGALFIDLPNVQNILLLAKKIMPSADPIISGFFVFDIFLFSLSVILGLIIKGRKNMKVFLTKSIIFTFLIEIIFILMGNLSLKNNQIVYTDIMDNPYLYQAIIPTVFQATIGAYIFITGVLICNEWWKNQRNNKTLMVLCLGWLWAIFSEILIYLTNSWFNMVFESNDKYTLICSVGAVIFTAGLITLAFEKIIKQTNITSKILLMSLLMGFVIFIGWKDYQYMNKFYHSWNEGEGGSGYWQDTMYKRFLDKIGRENFTGNIFVYIDPISNSGSFTTGSFANPMRYRIYYDEKGNLIRGTCRVLAVDIKDLEKTYIIKDGEEGFLMDTPCVDVSKGILGQTVFYPLSSFYAFKMENKQFIDIKEEVLSKLEPN